MYLIFVLVSFSVFVVNKRMYNQAAQASGKSICRTWNSLHMTAFNSLDSADLFLLWHVSFSVRPINEICGSIGSE